MRDALKNVFGKEIVLEDGTAFMYTVEPFEIKNILGQTAAVLDEYSFTQKAGIEVYKLYRTSDGNWYDMNTEMQTEKMSVLRQLKAALLTKNESACE